MKLPQNLVREISLACGPSLDADEVIRAVTALVSPDESKDYWVWVGAGFGHETLKLDVYVLGTNCLYNYFIADEATAGSCLFLDSIEEVGLLSVSHEKSPYILVIEKEEETSRLFGGPGDREKLEALRKKIIDASLSARNRR